MRRRPKRLDFGKFQADLEKTCPEFCQMLSELGEVVEVNSHPHWTGNWATAFSSAGSKLFI